MGEVIKEVVASCTLFSFWVGQSGIKNYIPEWLHLLHFRWSNPVGEKNISERCRMQILECMKQQPNEEALDVTRPKEVQCSSNPKRESKPIALERKQEQSKKKMQNPRTGRQNPLVLILDDVRRQVFAALRRLPSCRCGKSGCRSQNEACTISVSAPKANLNLQSRFQVTLFLFLSISIAFSQTFYLFGGIYIGYRWKRVSAWNRCFLITVLLLLHC